MSIWKDHNTYRYRVQRHGRVIAGGARTRAEAVELEAKALRDLQQHRLGLPPERTLADALARYLESPEFARLRERRRVIARIAEIETHLRGEAVQDAHLVADRIVSHGLKAGRSAYTVNAALRVLRRVLRVAARKWDWPARPDKLSLLPEPQRQTYLTPAEAKRLLAELEGDAKAWVLLALYGGFRASEIERLGADSVQGDLIVLDPMTKTMRPRVVPILQPLKWAVARLPLALRYDGMAPHFRRARAAIGRPDVRFHDCRHTYASWLAQSGATNVDIRDLLGHASIGTTSRYMHLSADRLRAAASRILLEGGSSAKARNRRKAA